jgi:hypothetical protein
MSSNMSFDNRRSAQMELNALLAKGKNFTFKYKYGGAVLFGIIFMSAGLIFNLIFLLTFIRKQPLHNGTNDIHSIREPEPAGGNKSIISEREYKLLLLIEKIRRNIGTVIKLSGILIILFISFFMYKVFNTMSLERKSDKTNAATLSVPSATERKPYYFYMQASAPIDERIKTAVNNWERFYKKPHSPHLVGYSGNNVYFKTIVMTEEKKDNFFRIYGQYDVF